MSVITEHEEHGCYCEMFLQVSAGYLRCDMVYIRSRKINTALMLKCVKGAKCCLDFFFIILGLFPISVFFQSS